ncbi:hypothetical protein ACNQFZ_00255 [Schinkia sp. CFF1]
MIVGTLLLMGMLFGCSPTTEKKDIDGSAYDDISSFRDSRMKLPAHRVMKTEQIDLDENGVTEEFSLHNGKITVKGDSHTIWESPDTWWIDYFFLGDTNNDGNFELNLLVWKEGSFGPHKPFWIEEEDTEVKNHLFIFKLEKSKIKPVWQSSNLDSPNYCADSIDLNGDGKNELITIEGSYTDPFKREITIWKWNGWGFSRISL